MDNIITKALRYIDDVREENADTCSQHTCFNRSCYDCVLIKSDDQIYEDLEDILKDNYVKVMDDETDESFLLLRILSVDYFDRNYISAKTRTLYFGDKHENPYHIGEDEFTDLFQLIKDNKVLDCTASEIEMHVDIAKSKQLR